MTGSLHIKNDTYYMVLNVYTNGKRKQKWVSTGLSAKGYNKRKADKMLLEALASGEIPIKEPLLELPPEQILFIDYMLDWDAKMKHYVKQVTWQHYHTITTKRIIPYFAPLKLTVQSIKPVHIQRFYEHCLTGQRLDGKKGSITASTLKHIHSNFHKALEDAVRLELIPYNPASRVTLPKRQKHQSKYYTPEQVKRLLVTIKGSFAEPAIFMAAHYGLRRSEAMGLKWSAINFEDGIVTIRHTVVATKGGVIRQDVTKTDSSYRVLPLMPQVRNFLLELKARQEWLKDAIGISFNPDGYICIKDDGTSPHPSSICRLFTKAMDKAGLPRIRFHDLRHTVASFLVKNGCNLKEIQVWLGHSDIGTTGNIYSHLDIEDMANASSKISNLLNDEAAS